MAYVVATKRGGFEIRESRSTPDGPRSRTLATFRELTDEVIEKARSRSAQQLSADDLRQAARRAGARGARDPADRAARELITELGKGRRLDPSLRRILLDQLRRDRPAEDDRAPVSDAARSVAEWMNATPKERGDALVDLLLLADALPANGRGRKPLEFPRLDSIPHG
jgi:hypothetical protein